MALPIFGQNPYYSTIDKSKGLPSNTVYDVLQDHNGMMWFATDEGLCSYDGHKFKLYSSENQIARSGSNIAEDQYGRIWYCSFDGFIYYLENGILKQLRQENSIGYQKFGIIKNYFVYLETNRLVFLDLKTLKRFKTVTIETIKVNAHHTFNGVYYLYGEKMYEIKSPDSITTYPIPSEIKNNFQVSVISNNKRELILLSKYSNHYCYYKNGTFYKHQFQNEVDFIQNTSYTSNLNWLSTTKGVIRCDFNNPIETKKRYFENTNVSNVLEDKDGNHWVCTINDGVLFVPSFDNMLIPTETSPSILTSSGGHLYYATQNEKLFESLTNNPFEYKILYSGNSKHSIDQLEIDSLNGKFYFTSNAFRIVSKNGSVQKELLLSVKDMKKLDDTYYAYAASGISGLMKVSDKKSLWDSSFQKNVPSSKMDENLSYLVSTYRGKSVTINREKNLIYFATNNGLFCVSPEKVIPVLFKNKPLYLTKVEAYKNDVYGLTNNNKLIKIDSNNQAKPLDFSKQTDDQVIEKIKLIDSDLFLFTTNSIFKLNLKNNSLEKVFNLDADNEISDLILYQKQLVLASSKGLIFIREKNKNKIVLPKLLLQSVFVNNKFTSFEKLKNLNHNEDNIEINFALISYLPNLKNILHYKINNGKWQTIDDESRSLKLSSLASGDYTIYFKTMLHNESSEIQKIQLSIQKPLWESYWFIGFMTFLIVSTIILFFRNQISKIKEQNQLVLEKIKLEKNLNKSTLKAIKSQMNPHFFYNALNTIQSYILSNDKKQAVNYLSKFSQLTRTILEMSEKENISIAEEIKAMNLYLEIEKARFNEDFEYEITTEDIPDLDHQKIPSMLLQPYIENAVKHGLLHKNGLKKLHVSFIGTKKTLEIKIDDNGIGRQKSAELNAIKNKNHQSFATEAMQNRIDLLNKNKTKKITINYIDKVNQNQHSTGTTVVIEIPIH